MNEGPGLGNGYRWMCTEGKEINFRAIFVQKRIFKSENGVTVNGQKFSNLVIFYGMMGKNTGYDVSTHVSIMYLFLCMKDRTCGKVRQRKWKDCPLYLLQKSRWKKISGKV